HGGAGPTADRGGEAMGARSAPRGQVEGRGRRASARERAAMRPEHATRLEADIEEATSAGAYDRAAALADRYRAQAGRPGAAAGPAAGGAGAGRPGAPAAGGSGADPRGPPPAGAPGGRGRPGERAGPLLERGNGRPDALRCRLLLAAAEAAARLGRPDAR